ncbi:Ataxin-1 [Fukomys damarensis]|uniref:Ataxin-1 n=1 Tax=Fukomys damarensis TaxID=885580 RepID=A0A091DNV8_FUKDA|nr:Ataxin-1 [Fukomys damarensis]
MKSNQERSNECLPPKKREIPATSRPSEEKVTVLPSDNHRAESVAWLPSNPGGRGHGGGRHGPAGTSVELGLQQGIGLHKSLSTGLDYSPPSAPRSVPAATTLPTAYPPPQSGTPVSPVQYAHLPHTFQFIGSSQYSGPYAGFIPSQLISPSANPPPHLGRAPGLITPGSPPPAQQNQYIHISSSPQSSGRPASPPAIPVHLHPHQTMMPHALTLGPSSQVVVQYTDSGGHFVPREPTKKAESGRLQQAKEGGLHLGKPSHRSYALSPHTVIQTTHSASEPLPVGLPTTAFYAGAQPPVIGYLSSQQQAITYAGSLPQHLVIPGTQPLLIPVGGADMEASGAASAIVTSSPHFAAVPHTFVTTALPKTENFTPEALVTQAAYPAMVQAQIHLPVVQSVASPAAAPPTLPPYFMKGSIIQLANGELKKVEDLKTEDFIQSAEISSDLKIDSSTVERIEDSHSPGLAIIQFAVGEHRAQVSVEVLVEYPFFVFGQGWSSCCPERTSQLFDLPCSKLSVGDVCISLTLKNPKNGSVKKGQPVDPASVLLKHSKADSLASSRHRYTEQENGISQGSAQMLSENGELKFPEKIGLPAVPFLTKIEPSKPAATRKRRWSAPETRKLEKSEDEPPLTLPKPSLIPQEVKICIEGRSNVGK